MMCVPNPLLPICYLTYSFQSASRNRSNLQHLQSKVKDLENFIQTREHYRSSPFLQWAKMRFRYVVAHFRFTDHFAQENCRVIGTQIDHLLKQTGRIRRLCDSDTDSDKISMLSREYDH